MATRIKQGDVFKFRVNDQKVGIGQIVRKYKYSIYIVIFEPLYNDSNTFNLPTSEELEERFGEDFQEFVNKLKARFEGQEFTGQELKNYIESQDFVSMLTDTQKEFLLRPVYGRVAVWTQGGYKLFDQELFSWIPNHLKLHEGYLGRGAVINPKNTPGPKMIYITDAYNNFTGVSILFNVAHPY